MQSTTVTDMSNQPPSHQFASAANAQARRIPPYVRPEDTPPSSKSPERPSTSASVSGSPVFCILNRTRTDDLRREAHQLIIRQDPGIGKVFIGKEKDRKPIDPPPVVQLVIDDRYDQHRRYLHSPYYFMSASLVDDVETIPNVTPEEAASALGGTLVSSLHKVKDITGAGDVAFFVFGDLSCKLEGWFRMKFTLFEVRGKEVEYIRDITSNPFQVYSAKTWPGMAESTPMTRMLSDQGIRLRLRKEPRFRLQPQGPASDDYSPRRYAARRSKSIVDPETRRESHASTMAPTPQETRSDGSADQSADQADEDQYVAAVGSPGSPTIAPQPLQPMASFISDSRKRELSASYHATPPPDSMGGGAGGRNEPIPKRTRPDEEAGQPDMYGQHYSTPQNMDQSAQQRMYENQNQSQNQEAMQMYSHEQFGPPQQQYSRQPAYSHGPSSYMTGGGRQGPGFDFQGDREAMSMSPFQQRNAMNMNPPESQFAQRQPSDLGMQYDPALQQQSMVNPSFTPQSIPYQQMLHQQQQRMRQSMPARALNTSMSDYDYDNPSVDPALDPLLAGHQRPQGMPRMSVPNIGSGGGMGGHPPQYYNRPVQSHSPQTMNSAQQQQEQFYESLNAGQGIGMRGVQPGMQPGPETGVGFRGVLPPLEGVGFREPFVGESPIASQHGSANSEEFGEMGHHN